uniref:Protein-serine/threonine phosphatase n=1 Tax=Thermosporothrix sp. COM3 TaxID=2490863 RepID=A0A455SN33_9CHLR|nr:protein-serine/threonine phosphatase [Thermosporothrix sp. COM3]
MNIEFLERLHSSKMPQYNNIQSTILTNDYGPIALPPFTFAFKTTACERHPTRNEDSILLEEETGLAAVFDGVGGSAAGEVASQTAVQATRQEWKRIVRQFQQGRKKHTFLEYTERSHLPTLLERLILNADEQVRTEGARRAGTDNLATTVALAAICRIPGQRHYKLLFSHVGDSRIYLLRSDESLKRLTTDDGLLGKLVENQLIDNEDALHIDQACSTEQLSDVEFSYFRLRGGITQALGGPIAPTVHLGECTIYPGDRLLLCTDGIHDNLTDKEIEAVLRNSSRNAAARILVEQSIERSHEPRNINIRAKPDDMSAIVITCRF